MNGWPAWVWLVLGVLLMLAELVVPSFFIFWFGLAVLWRGRRGGDPAAEFATSGARSLAGRFPAARDGVVWLAGTARRRSRIGASDAAVGEIGWVSEAIEPQRRGKVRFQRPVLGAEEWPALADEPIGEDERVRVVAVEGQMVKVARLRQGDLEGCFLREVGK